MLYLTSSHQHPTAYVDQNGMLHPTTEALAQQDVIRLAELGIYPHQMPTDPAPLGIDWTLTDGVYIGTPAGSAEDIASALAAQAEASVQSTRAALTCTQRQARIALTQQNMLAAVEAFVQAGSDTLKIEWQYATEIKRTWPPVAEFAAANGVSDEELDALFALAASL